MGFSQHCKARKEGQRVLDRQYAKRQPPAWPGLPAGQIVAYREDVLDEVEKRLAVIVEKIGNYDPVPGKRRVKLFRLVLDIAGEVLAADDLFRVLAEVERLQSKGD